MTTLFAVALICPRCGEPFLSTALGSYGSSGQDTDFRPHFWGFDPLPLMLHRCPRCRYVAEDDAFARADLPYDACTPPRDAEDDPVRRYTDAARCAREDGRPPLHIASLLHRGAWCARNAGRRDVERELMAEAAREYGRALDAGGVDAEEAPALAYVIGELLRRCGRFEEALAWFDRAAGYPLTPEQAEWLPALIGEQRTLAESADSRPKVIGQPPDRPSLRQRLLARLRGGRTEP